jgi:tRNA(fMet)-specific endonuclease VapC
VRFLLDTDTCIWILRQDPEVRSHLEKLTPSDVAVSAMNVAELLYGALDSQDPPRRIKDVEAFLAPILVLPFDAEAAMEHARLRLALKSKPIAPAWPSPITLPSSLTTEVSSDGSWA